MEYDMRDHISQQRRGDEPHERERPRIGGHHDHHEHRRGHSPGEHEAREFRHGGPGGGPGGGRGERGERGGRRGEGRGPRGGPRFTDAEPTPVSTEAITGWLTGRLPEGWFTGAPRIDVDRDEIWVVGDLADVPAGGAEAEEGRISRFREETREQRMAVAREAEQRYERRIAWGATAGSTTAMFSTASG
jgi:hypothetical protein